MSLFDYLRSPKFLAEDPDKQEDVIDTYVEAARQEALSNNGLGGDPRKYFQAVEEAEAAKFQLGLTKDTRPTSQILKDQFVGGLNSAVNATVALKAVSGLTPPAEAAAEIAANKLEDSQKPVSRAMLKYQKAGDKGWAAPILNVLANPQVAAEITAQGLGTSVPGLVAGGAAASLAGFLKGGPMVRALATAGAVGSASAFVEGGSQILEDLQAEAGGDLTNTEAVTQALSNPEVLAKLRERAFKRGASVGAFDAASVLAPASRIFDTAKGLKGLIAKGALDTVIQGGLGGAGEIAGNVAIGEQTNPSDFWAEVIGEVMPGIAETVIAGRGELTPQTDQALLEKARKNQAKVFATGTVDAPPVMGKKRASDFTKTQTSEPVLNQQPAPAAVNAPPAPAAVNVPPASAPVAAPKPAAAKPVSKKPKSKAEDPEDTLPEEERKAPFVIHNSGVGTSSAVGTLAKKYNFNVQPTLGTQDSEQMVIGDLDRADLVIRVGNEESLRNDPGQMQQRRAALKNKKSEISGGDTETLLLRAIEFLRENPKTKNLAFIMPQETAVNTTASDKQSRIEQAENTVDRFLEVLSRFDPDPAIRDYTTLENEIRDYTGQTKSVLADLAYMADRTIPEYRYASRESAANWLNGQFVGPEGSNRVLVFQTDASNSHTNIHGPIAKKLGAKPGQAGFSGQTYALPYFKREKTPSKKKLSREEESAGLDITKTSRELKAFLDFAKNNPTKEFWFMPSTYTGGFSRLDERRLWDALAISTQKGMRIPRNIRPTESTFENAIARSAELSKNPSRVASVPTRRTKKMELNEKTGKKEFKGEYLRGRNNATLSNLDKVEAPEFRPVALPDTDPSLTPEQKAASKILAKEAATLTRADRIRGEGFGPMLTGLVIGEREYQRGLRPFIEAIEANKLRKALGRPKGRGLYRPKDAVGGQTNTSPFPFRAYGASARRMKLLVQNVRQIGSPELSTEEAERIAQFRPGSLAAQNSPMAPTKYLVEFFYGTEVNEDSINRSIVPSYTVRTTQATTNPEVQKIESESFLEDFVQEDQETEITFGAQGTRKIDLATISRYQGLEVRKETGRQHPIHGGASIAFLGTNPDGSRYISINPQEVERTFQEKQWTNPRVSGIKPFPPDMFLDINEWTTFLLEHETQHQNFPVVRPSDGAARYADNENAINWRAIKLVNPRVIKTQDGGYFRPVGNVGKNLGPGNVVRSYLDLKWSPQGEVTIEGIDPDVKLVPMRYNAPVEGLRKDLQGKYPEGTTTLKMIQDGVRKATTRSKPLGRVGELVSFENDPTMYRITAVRSPGLNDPKATPEQKKQAQETWEALEGWSLDYIRNNPSLASQVFSPRAVQTVFEPFVGKPLTPDGRLSEFPAIAGLRIPFAHYDNLVADLIEGNQLPITRLIEKSTPVFRRLSVEEANNLRASLELLRRLVAGKKPGQGLNDQERKLLQPFFDMIGRQVELQSMVREQYTGRMMGNVDNMPRPYLKALASRLLNDENITSLVDAGSIAQPSDSEVLPADPVRKYKDGALANEIVPVRAVFTPNEKVGNTPANSLLLQDENGETLLTLPFTWRDNDYLNATKTNIVSQDLLLTPGISLMMPDQASVSGWRKLTDEERKDISWLEKAPVSDYRARFLDEVIQRLTGATPSQLRRAEESGQPARFLNLGNPVGIPDPETIAFVKAHPQVFTYEHSGNGIVITAARRENKEYTVDLPVPGAAGDFSKIFYRMLKPFFQLQEDEFNRSMEFGTYPVAPERMTGQRYVDPRVAQNPGYISTGFQAVVDRENLPLTAEESFGSLEALGDTVQTTDEQGPVLSVFSQLEQGEEMAAGSPSDVEESMENEEFSRKPSVGLRSLRQHLLVRPNIAAAIRKSDPEGRYVKLLVLPQVMYQKYGDPYPVKNDFTSGSAIITGIVDPISGEKLGVTEALVGLGPDKIRSKDEIGELLRQAFLEKQESARYLQLPANADFAAISAAYRKVRETLRANPGSVFILDRNNSDLEDIILKGLEYKTSYDIIGDKIHFTGVYDNQLDKPAEQRNPQWIGQLPYGAPRYRAEEIAGMSRDQAVETARLINNWLTAKRASRDVLGVDDPKLTDGEIKSRLQLLQVIAKTYLEGLFPEYSQTQREMAKVLDLSETKRDLLLEGTLAGRNEEGVLFDPTFQEELNNTFNEDQLEILPVLIDHAARVFNTGIVYQKGKAKAGAYSQEIQGRPRELALIHLAQNTNISEQEAHNLIDSLSITSDAKFDDSQLFKRLFIKATTLAQQGGLQGNLAAQLNGLVDYYTQANQRNEDGLPSNPDLFVEPAMIPPGFYRAVYQLVMKQYEIPMGNKKIPFKGLVERIKAIHSSVQRTTGKIPLVVTSLDVGKPMGEESNIPMLEEMEIEFEGETQVTESELERALLRADFDAAQEGRTQQGRDRRTFLNKTAELRNTLDFRSRMLHDIVLTYGFGIRDFQHDPSKSLSHSHVDYVFGKVRSNTDGDFLRGSELAKALNYINDFPVSERNPDVLSSMAKERYEAIRQLLPEPAVFAEKLQILKNTEKADREYTSGLLASAKRFSDTVKEKRNRKKTAGQETTEQTRQALRKQDIERQFAERMVESVRQRMQTLQDMRVSFKDARYETLEKAARIALAEMFTANPNYPESLRIRIEEQILGPRTRVGDETPLALDPSRERQRLFEVLTGDRGLVAFYGTMPWSANNYQVELIPAELDPAAVQRASEQFKRENAGTETHFVFIPQHNMTVGIAWRLDIGKRRSRPYVNFQPLLNDLELINQPYVEEARRAKAAETYRERVEVVRSNLALGERENFSVDERLRTLKDAPQQKAVNRLLAMARSRGLQGVHFAIGKRSLHPVYTTFNIENDSVDTMDNTIFINPVLLAEKIVSEDMELAFQPKVTRDPNTDEIIRVDLAGEEARRVGDRAFELYEKSNDQLANNYLTHEVAHLAYMNQIRREFISKYNGNPPANSFKAYYRKQTDGFADFLKDPQNGLQVKLPGRKPMNIVEAVGSMYDLTGTGQNVNNDTLVAEFLRMMLEIEKSSGTIITEVSEEQRREMSGRPGITRFIDFLRRVLDSLYSLFQGLQNSRDPRANQLYQTYHKVNKVYDTYFSAYMESRLPDGQLPIGPNVDVSPVFGAGYRRPKVDNEAVSERYIQSINGDQEDIQQYPTRGVKESLQLLEETGSVAALDEILHEITPEMAREFLKAGNIADPDKAETAVLGKRALAPLTMLDRVNLLTYAATKLKNGKSFARGKAVADEISATLRGMGQTISIVGRTAKLLFFEDPAAIVADYSQRIAESRRTIGEKVKPEMDEIVGVIRETQAAAIASILGEQKVQALITTLNNLYGEELRLKGINGIQEILKDQYTQFSGESLLAVLSRLLPKRKLEDRTLESLSALVEENMRTQLANRFGFGGRSAAGKILGRFDNTDLQSRDERIQQILERMVSKAKPPMFYKGGYSLENAIAGDAKMILELAVKGALSQEEVLGVIQSLGKFPSFDLNTANQLRSLMEEAKVLPANSFMRDRILWKALGQLHEATQPKSSMLAGLASAYYYFSLLSGPATLMVNFVSTYLKVHMDILSYSYAAAAARKGLVGGIPLAGKLAGLAFKTFYASLNTIAQAEAKGILLKGDANPRTMGKYVTEETISALESMDTSTLTRKILSNQKYLFRFMSASDAYLGRGAMEGFAHMQAYLKASENVEQGLTTYPLEQEVARLLAQTDQELSSFTGTAERDGFKPGSADFIKRVYELRDNAIKKDPSREAIISRAEEMSLFATYNNEPYGLLGLMAKLIGDFSRQYWIGSLFVPFTKIVSNVTNESINYTPLLGVGRGIWDLKKSGVKFGEKLSGYPSSALELQKVAQVELAYQRISQSLVGTTLLFPLMLMALSSLKRREDEDDEDQNSFVVTAQGPKDPRNLRQAKEGGFESYSLQFADGYKLKYNATPLAIPLAIVGTWIDNERFPRGRDKTPQEIVMSSALAIIQAPFDQSFLQGLSNLFSLVDGRFEGEDTRALEKFMGDTVGLLSPNVVRQIEQIFEPVPPTQTTFAGKVIANKFPVIRHLSGKPTLNVLAEPVKAPAGPERYVFLQRFINSVEGDPLFKILMNKNTFIPDVKTDAKVGNLPLNDEQRYRFREIRGQLLARVLRTQQFYNFAAQATPEQLQEQISATASKATRAAKRQMAQELIASGINPMDGSLLTE